MGDKFRKFNITTQIVQQSDWYNVDPLCNGFTVTNIGDTIVRFNNLILYPGTIGTSLGDSRSFGGNEGEIYKGQFKVEFTPGGANPQLEIVQKVYIDEKEIK